MFYMNKKTKYVVTGGLMAAMIVLGTVIFKIPVPIQSGYVNLGDGFIILTGFLLGPIAAVVAAVGSAISDVLAGYAVYAPATFIIKGLMGLVAGLMFYKFKKNVFIPTIIASIICEAIMVFGYFVFEYLFLKLGAAAYADMLPNGVQAIAGIIIALIIVPIMKKILPYIGLVKE
jgi:uncharacterized membrane protein